MFELVETSISYNKRSCGIGTIVGYRQIIRWRSKMNPVIGLDVAKGTSVAQAFLERGNPYGKAKKIKHSQEGFQSLHSLLTEMTQITGMEPSIVLEATGTITAAL
jgi:hypothetical protein